MTRLRLAVALLMALGGPAAADETFLTAETPAAMAVSDVQESVFRPGAMPAVGAYAGRPVGAIDLAIGARLRFGALRNGPSPQPNMADPKMGGLGTLALAVRAAYHGVWIEAAGGGGLTGSDLVPTFELGTGFLMRVGSVAIGPSLRYVRVVSRDPMDAFGSADLALVGVDFKFGGRKGRDTTVARIARAPVPPPVDVEVVGAGEDDHDAIVERATSCAEDLDGCPLAPDVFVAEGRIAFDDRVLFELNRAHIHARGREALDHLAQVWRQHPEWTRIVVEGHADTRGTDAYNQWLSELRASRVRDALIKRGFAPEAIDAKGYGCTHPRDKGTDEDAYQKNRRVEFVIVTKDGAAHAPVDYQQPEEMP